MPESGRVRMFLAAAENFIGRRRQAHILRSSRYRARRCVPARSSREHLSVAGFFHKMTLIFAPFKLSSHIYFSQAPFSFRNYHLIPLLRRRTFSTYCSKSVREAVRKRFVGGYLVRAKICNRGEPGYRPRGSMRFLIARSARLRQQHEPEQSCNIPHDR